MADNANKEIKTATADDGSTGYEMKIGLGTIAMLISATGMGLVPLFSRWATRTDMFDGALGLNAGDSIGALMAVGRMSMGVLFFVVIMFATGVHRHVVRQQPDGFQRVWLLRRLQPGSVYA